MKQERAESVSGWPRALKFFRKCWHMYTSSCHERRAIVYTVSGLAYVVQIKKMRQEEQGGGDLRTER